MLFLLSAFFVKRALNSYEEYTLCGRNLTIGYIIFTYLGTWVGGGTIIGLAGRAYDHGAVSYWVFASSCLVSFLFAFVFITRIRKLKLNSIGDMFAKRYPQHNEAVRMPVAFSLVVRNVTMIGMQFAAVSYLVSYAFNISFALSAVITFVVITAYTVLSGFWSIVSTDIFQGILQTIGLLLIIWLCVRAVGGTDDLMSFFVETGQESHLKIMGGNFGKWAKDMALYMFSFGMFFIMGDECDWERIYAAKTDKAAFWGFLIPVTMMLIILLTPTYIGVFEKALELEPRESVMVVYTFLINMVTPTLAAFIIVTLLAAMMSSADSYMFATGVIISNDIVKRFFKKDASDKELIFWTRTGIVVSGVIGLIFAICLEDIVKLWIVGMAVPVLIVIPAYLFAWFSNKVNTKGVLVGMIFGCGYTLAIIVSKTPLDYMAIITGTVFNAAITYLTSVVTGGNDETPEMNYNSQMFEDTKQIPR